MTYELDYSLNLMPKLVRLRMPNKISDIQAINRLVILESKPKVSLSTKRIVTP